MGLSNLIFPKKEKKRKEKEFCFLQELLLINLGYSIHGWCKGETCGVVIVLLLNCTYRAT